MLDHSAKLSHLEFKFIQHVTPEARASTDRAMGILHLLKEAPLVHNDGSLDESSLGGSSKSGQGSKHH